MEKGVTILIADRNSHVREFLRRELIGEGYRIRLAKNGREVLSDVKENGDPDLLILDLDIPYAGEGDIFEKVREQSPALPVVIHTFLPNYDHHISSRTSTALVEKEGSNIDRLKEVIMEVLRRPAGRPPAGVDNRN